MFNVNLTSVITWLLPSFLRGNAITALIKALVLPLQNLHLSLDAFRTQKQYELNITSQVIWLEKMLNNIFDPINEQIYIEDVEADVQVYIAHKYESHRPPYIYHRSESAYPTFIYHRNEVLLQSNFTVMVPVLIYNGLLQNNSSGLNKMKASINKYKLFGTTYTIQSYLL